MTRHLGWLWAGAILLSSAAHAVTVDGLSFLWGQSDHAGTRILFSARSPSAVTDSAFTDTYGNFNIALSPGVYDVRFSHADFADYPLPNQALLFDTTLEPVELYVAVSGPLSGDFGYNWVQIVDSISVETGQTLTIRPGTRLFFEPRAKFVVRGRLNAVGALGDSIVFTKRYAHADSGWGGIRFLYADNASRIEYCVVEGGRKSYSSNDYYSRGGGVYVVGCSPALFYCSIRNNRTQGAYCEGGGLAIGGGSPNLFQCDISRNSSESNWAGGVFCGGGSEARFERCLISENACGGVRVESRARPLFEQCHILDNDGSFGGVSLYEDSSTVFRDCIIARNNASYSIGGGVRASYSFATLERCLITQNVGAMPGFYCSWGSPRLIQCTVVDNHSTQGGYPMILLSETSAEINSCIVGRDVSGAAIYFEHSPVARVIYTDFWGIPDSMFAFENSPSQDGPAAIGIVALTNANGDSCDTYYNIFLDPQFADTAAGDYHLTEGSPCIDAGDPALELDPDGTVADMGAFYFSQLAAEEERTSVRRYELRQNYPNPFNAQTRIAFALARGGEAGLDVFDVTGRLVQTLARGPISAGTHEILFDARDLPSGMYFARLSAGAFVETKKMLLVK